MGFIMRFSIHLLIFGVMLLSGCGPNSTLAPNEMPTDTPPPSNKPAPYPDLGVAPELTNEVWLNVSTPLRLADLRGKVVLVDMWTFG